MSTQLKQASFDQIIADIQALETDTILLVIDHYFWSLFQNEFPLDKAIEGKRIISWKAPNGEQVKSFQEFESCLEFFLEKGIHRKAHMIAVGGGATSDFAGFVAASLLRGIPWSVVPTTLLSMVDASIGGKVAINSRFGKNLVGAFHTPQHVWLNSQFLSRLDKKEVLSGQGEVLKYAFLDKKIHKLISTEGTSLDDVIQACADYKLKLTEEDFKESGKRKILNLGHSLGHAIERIYTLPHGEAVMWGMVLIFKLFGDQGLIDTLAELKLRLGWAEVDPPWKNRQFPLDKIMDYLSKDKKMIDNSTMDLILIEKIGKPIIKSTPLSEIEKRLEEARDELKTFTL